VTIEREISSNTPLLNVRCQGTNRKLRAGRSYTIGRDPESDIVIDEARVSWRHAVLRIDGTTWVLEDAGSSNGTFVDGRRVTRVEITDTCVAWLGHPDNGQRLRCSVAAPPVITPPAVVAPPAVASPPAATPPAVPARPAAPAPAAPARAAPAPAVRAVSPVPEPGTSFTARQPTSITRLPSPAQRLLRIGRAADNDVAVQDLSVSRYHAELRQSATGRGYEIVDLHSHNGTFVNGQRVTSAPVTESDIIAVGPATFRLVGQELQEFIDTGDISLNVQGLSVRLASGKVLLDQVSFPLSERCLLGVIGPSGAGKSTLLGALTGTQPAGQGSVLYDDRDLYQNYAELRYRIGLVPQQDIMHSQLSARRALRYTAELRFPRDTSARERSHRVDEVIEELGLAKHAQTRAESLSGGQRKRVSVALELLTKPSLLFLDEPTSGLDPGLDKSVMEMLAGLAHDGRTVIVVTHSVANLDLCDRLLVLVPGGKVAFFGPPREGLRYFGKPGWAEVFQAFEAEPDRDWAAEFRRSALHAQYVTPATQPAAQQRQPRQQAPAPRRRNRLAQLSTLVRRYLAVIASDRGYLGFLAGAPIILAAIIRAFPAAQGLTGRPGSNASAEGLLLILAVGACFAGALNAIREIVKERPIYARERAAGLSSTAYIWSKLLVLGVISALQVVVMALIGLAGRPMPAHGALLGSPLLELVLAMAVLAIASMTLGLLISAIVKTSERALPLLFLSVMAQLVFTGGIFSLNGKVGLDQISWFFPSRWGFAATASTVNFGVISPASPGTKPDPLWNHTGHTWLMDMGLQVVLAGVLAFLTWRRLKGQAPGRRR
jgi:ABC transport system ATP-binding/permease protein